MAVVLEEHDIHLRRDQALSNLQSFIAGCGGGGDAE